jgi:hypothetical protein
MAFLPNEPVLVDCDNTENWLIHIYDSDLDGKPIPHTGQTLYAQVKDADGSVVFEAEMGDELSIIPGTDNGVQLLVPWGVVKDLPAAQYYCTIVVIESETSRDKVIDLVIRHEVK